MITQELDVKNWTVRVCVGACSVYVCLLAPAVIVQKRRFTRRHTNDATGPRRRVPV